MTLMRFYWGIGSSFTNLFYDNMTIAKPTTLANSQTENRSATLTYLLDNIIVLEVESSQKYSRKPARDVLPGRLPELGLLGCWLASFGFTCYVIDDRNITRQ